MIGKNNPFEPDPNFEVFNEEIETKLKEIGHLIGDRLPPNWGFFLGITSYGDKGSLFYISNCERSGMIKLLKELISKIKGRK